MSAVVEATVLRKVTLRLIPFLFLLYVVNLIDRTNIGIAKLQMVGELRLLSEADYSLGSGIFYIGYFIFEVPSNLILMRVGARVWMARIIVTWGLISACMAFATDPLTFTILRFLLGVAEAGFFPGIVLYLSLWFPLRARARAMAIFMAGGVITSIINNPLSGIIVQYMDEVGGIWGWQWLFFLEGLPAVLLGFITLGFLTDRPSQANWLTAAERNWLTGQMELEDSNTDRRRSHTLWAALVSVRVWILIVIYFTVALAENCYSFYGPSFVKSRLETWTTSEIGFLLVVPSLFAIVGMNIIGWHSDFTGERRWHVAGSAFLSAGGWTLMGIADSPWVFIAGMAMATTGTKSVLPTFWTLPPAFLSGAAAAGGLALINSVGNLGGYVGPQIIGAVKTATESFRSAYFVIAGTLGFGGILVFVAHGKGDRVRREPTVE